MIFYLIAVDYKKLPLDLQEKAFKQRSQIQEFLEETGSRFSLLFTCQRLEVYGLAEDVHSVLKVQSSLRQRFPAIFLKSALKVGTRAVGRYGLRLALGLESQILGEPQIVFQLRRWSEESEILPLREFWQKILNQAQEIKTASKLKIPEVDLSSFVIKDLINKLAGKEKKEILVVGTGAIAQLFARNRPKNFVINFASRKRHSRARRLARASGGQAILLDQISEFIPRIDALIGATSSPHYVVCQQHLSSLAKRKEQLYVYDLAVPRDIFPDLRRLEQVSLEDLRSLNRLFDVYRSENISYIQESEPLIEASLDLIKEEGDEDFKSRDPAELTCLATS